MSTTVVNFYSAKGGQGCSTVAALTAFAAPASARVMVADNHNGTFHAVFGLPAIDNPADIVPIVPGLFLTDLTERTEHDPFDTYLISNYDLVVIDHGTRRPPDADNRNGERWILVTRPCYLALTAAVKHGTSPDHIVMVAEPGRALTTADVEAVLGADVTTIDADPGIARAVDAGLLASRPPQLHNRLAHLAAPAPDDALTFEDR